MSIESAVESVRKFLAQRRLERRQIKPKEETSKGKAVAIPKEVKEIVRSKERIKQTGEIFTPLKLVDEILSKLPEELFKDPSKTFIDPACGDGNFLVRVIAFKIQHGSTIEQALETTYGIDIMLDNVEACRERLLALADNYDQEVFGFEEIEKKYGHIVNNNIICGDALKLLSK